MGARIVIGVVILAGVAVVAWWLGRRRPDAPPRDGYPVPAQLDRTDFPRPEAPWLVALFSSAACDSCRTMPAKIAALESVEVATVDVSAEQRGELHRRYAIAAIPTLVVADGEGVVRKGFVGSVSATDLWAALAELRDPAAGDPLTS